MSPSVSVVIPTLNAEGEIGPLVDILLEQTVAPCEILVIDSSSDDRTTMEAGLREGVRVASIPRRDFNHGTTRDAALRQTTGDIVCFLTQDAVPASDCYLENLLAPFARDSNIALVSGRQLPKADARCFEQLVRSFNYPNEPTVRNAEDLPKFGIKTFFASDVCSAYRRDAYLKCGGFPAVNTNEDMLMAARFVGGGYRIAYEPSAEVYHSHNLTPLQQYKRNREVGKFLAEHSGELMDVSELGEGGKLVKYVASTLIGEGRIGELLSFAIDCAARLLGNRIGRRAALKEFKKTGEANR